MSARREGTQFPEKPPRQWDAITCRSKETGNGGANVLRVALSLAGRVGIDLREGYGSAITKYSRSVLAGWRWIWSMKICHQADKAPEGIGDSSPGDMDKGLCNSNTRRVAPPLSHSCTIRLIAFGIRCVTFMWSLCSSASRQLSTWRSIEQTH
jgi:hypothetical protein